MALCFLPSALWCCAFAEQEHACSARQCCLCVSSSQVSAHLTKQTRTCFGPGGWVSLDLQVQSICVQGQDPVRTGSTVENRLRWFLYCMPLRQRHPAHDLCRVTFSYTLRFVGTRVLFQASVQQLNGAPWQLRTDARSTMPALSSRRLGCLSVQSRIVYRKVSGSTPSPEPASTLR